MVSQQEKSRDSSNLVSATEQFDIYYYIFNEHLVLVRWNSQTINDKVLDNVSASIKVLKI